MNCCNKFKKWDDENTLNGRYAFHLFETHGIPLETVEGWVQKLPREDNGSS